MAALARLVACTQQRTTVAKTAPDVDLKPSVQGSISPDHGTLVSVEAPEPRCPKAAFLTLDPGPAAGGVAAPVPSRLVISRFAALSLRAAAPRRP